jgi:WhiB family redox-sensing transcriptional regulator
MSTPIKDGVFLWQDEAECRGINTDTFFDDVRQAKKICSGCPVLGDCLQYALIYNLSGVWGGTTDKERSRIPKIEVEMLRDDAEESGLYNRHLKV